MLCAWTFVPPWMCFPIVSLEQVVNIWTEEVDDVVGGKLTGQDQEQILSVVQSLRRSQILAALVSDQ